MLALLFVAAAFGWGCASVPPAVSPAQLETEIARQRARIAQDPGDVDAVRDLGVLYLYADDLTQASQYLQRAVSRDADDPNTLFYLGLVYEKLGQRDNALLLYRRYEDVPRTSPLRRRLRARYEQLTREAAQASVRALLAQERALTGELTVPHRVAVFPLGYVGSSSQYAALGRGLAELVSVDLARVEALDVLERVQLQALLDELELGQSGYVDPATAPRLGRILGAGRIVGGTFDVLDRDRAVRLDALIAAGDGEVTPVSAPGALQALFEVEKELVFGLLTAMDVELTPAERELIQSVPTRNLQAFLLYSRGLQASDRGDYGAAAQLFQQAVALDPGFGAAAEQAEAAAGAAEVGGPPDDALSAAGLPEGLVEVSVDLMGLRHQSLNASIGAHVLPGPDARKPAQEGLGDLPVPPPPGSQ